MKTLFLVLSILFLTLAAATLIPHSSSTVSDLGYYTFCPFAPWSTLTLLFFAALGWIVKDTKEGPKLTPKS